MTINNTLFVGKVLFHFPQLPSTNDYAFELLKSQKVAEGTLVHTDHQYRGKGQMGNTWESNPNENISASIIFHPKFLHPNEQFYLNMAVSLAARTTLAQYTQAKVEIKWPNDILINEKKAAGILIQNILSGTKIQSSVVGIGINVNQRSFSNPIKNASSLSLVTDQTYQLTEILQTLCQQLEANYLLLKQRHYQLLRAAYFEHLFRYQRWANYRLPEEHLSSIQGKIIDVLETGQLLVEHSDHTRAYQFKEIQFIY
ncbi:MAG: biotin--[acetyl-CoA-carboxylase] ligase [Bacteroidota bacterium]